MPVGQPRRLRVPEPFAPLVLWLWPGFRLLCLRVRLKRLVTHARADQQVTAMMAPAPSLNGPANHAHAHIQAHHVEHDNMRPVYLGDVEREMAPREIDTPLDLERRAEECAREANYKPAGPERGAQLGDWLGCQIANH